MAFFPSIGHGIGLRPVHYPEIIGPWPAIDWFEILSENYMVPGGPPRRSLRKIQDRYPIAMHGVSMSLGSVDALDVDYLSDLKKLADDVQPAWLSDHLCWAGLGGHRVHDLWPLPLTQEALDHVVRRIIEVQERLNRQILIENPSTYAQFEADEMDEHQFLVEMATRADCGILLDVNNVYVSAYNHGFDARAYIAALPSQRIGQIHLAGHTDFGTHLLDTHDQPVCKAVWQLYEFTVLRHGKVSTLLERDDHIPPLPELLAESRRAAEIERAVLDGQPARWAA